MVACPTRGVMEVDEPPGLIGLLSDRASWVSEAVVEAVDEEMRLADEETPGEVARAACLRVWHAHLRGEFSEDTQRGYWSQICALHGVRFPFPGAAASSVTG